MVLAKKLYRLRKKQPPGISSPFSLREPKRNQRFNLINYSPLGNFRFQVVFVFLSASNNFLKRD